MDREQEGKIRRADLGNRNLKDLVGDVDQGKGVVLDLTAGKMYWVDKGSCKFRWENLGGTGMKTLIEGVVDSRGIALDADSAHIYCTTYSANCSIQRAAINGFGDQEFISGSLKAN